MTRAAPREKQITKRIVEWLRSQRHYVVKLHGSPYQRAGLPDLLCLIQAAPVAGLECYATPLFIEVKKPGEKPTPLQLSAMRTLRAAGARVLVATSIDDVRDAVASIVENGIPMPRESAAR